ncbi:SAM-dependent methyltransferase, partial [Microcoleus sp. HI-ES]|nr:SAM-dependent methyltransferase [Microcoleus sp. HI-ES]
QGLTERELYRLIELLDTEITHYEFFLGKKPVNKIDWSDDQALLAAIPELSGCMHGWPSQQVFDCNYQLLNLSSAEFEFLQGCLPPPAPPYQG